MIQEKGKKVISPDTGGVQVQGLSPEMANPSHFYSNIHCVHPRKDGRLISLAVGHNIENIYDTKK